MMLAAALALAACGAETAGRLATTAPTIAATDRPSVVDRVAGALPLSRSQPQPAMRWGETNPAWTEAALAALNDEGITLLSSVPADVMQYCPGYATQSRENRAAFWAGLLSAVARHESGWNAGARGGGGRHLGLMQISSPTAKAHGCAGSLLTGEDNLQCAVRIMARAVVRDGAIAGGTGGWRGAARDWMALRSGAKRADIAGWTRKQSYCRMSAPA